MSLMRLFASCARKITSQLMRPLPARAAFAGLDFPFSSDAI
jgi:hypothetical protein